MSVTKPEANRRKPVRDEAGPVTAEDPRYLAVVARDRRFDGQFFTAVTSTGIYCRPICPARTPKPENVRFFPNRAAAEAAGFRACLRCRPHLAPEYPARELAAAALKLITAGALDTADGPAAVESLAAELRVSSRHLRRVMAAEVGVGPLAVARTRRVQTARTLLETTDMPVTDVAFVAGFGSIRQFNDTFRAAFGCTPTAYRGVSPACGHGSDDGFAVSGSGALILRSKFYGACDLRHLVSWFASRAVTGVEEVTGPESYRRTVRLPGGCAVVGFGPELTASSQPQPQPTSQSNSRSKTGSGPGIGDIRGASGNSRQHGTVVLSVDPDQIRDVAAAIDVCRGLLDLDADTDAINGVLAADPVLARLVAARPGLRIPGVADGFEMAVRAVLGQQVSVAAARTFAQRLVLRHGEVYSDQGPLTRLFPAAAKLVGADLSGLGLTGARIRTITALAAAVVAGDLALDRRHAQRESTRAALLALPGIGPWTADYLAMRVLGDPDVFPVGDLVLRQSASRLGLPADEKALLTYAERWRPWRSYAAMHLWADHVPPARGIARTATETARRRSRLDENKSGANDHRGSE